MPAQTSQGIPYPVGTDRVSDGDNAIQALAEWLDRYVCFGAATLAAPDGPGPNASKWFTSCSSLAVGGGVTVNTNGIVLPRKGWYQIHATGSFSVGVAGNQGVLFTGDGSSLYASASTYFTSATTARQSVGCQTVVQLPAGFTVRWGMSSAGATGVGIDGNTDGPTRPVLLARLLVPLP